MNWYSGLRITLSDDDGKVFAIHDISADEATHLLVDLNGREIVGTYGLDLDRIGDKGSEDYQNDLHTALVGVIQAAKDIGHY